MFKKLKQHRFLFEELVKRDFKKKYTRTVLGIGWSVLSPLLYLLVMSIVFTQFFGRNSPHYTIYLFCGILMYNFFGDSTREGMSSLMSNAHIFSKVNVPKYLFLLAKNVQTLVNFAIILVVFFGFCIFDGITFSWKMLLLIYPISCMVLLNVGVGMILSALFMFFRDVQYLWSVFLQLLMYMSAIFYKVESYAPAIRKFFHINPVFNAIYYFRQIVIDSTIPSVGLHLLMLGYALAAFGVGCWMYKKYNHQFLYYV